VGWLSDWIVLSPADSTNPLAQKLGNQLMDIGGIREGRNSLAIYEILPPDIAEKVRAKTPWMAFEIEWTGSLVWFPRQRRGRREEVLAEIWRIRQ
jgi:hypothetical protein